jgi:hypothetical protein
MHELVEHTNEDHGNGYHELVPWVVGMSIPHAMDAKAWGLFCLAHFKPFDASTSLIGVNEDVVDIYKKYAFSDQSRRVMVNWEVIHECEDERDADRLRKQALTTAESKALSLSLSLAATEDADFLGILQNSIKQYEEDFRIQQIVLLMQQARWLAGPNTQLGCQPVSMVDPTLTDHTDFAPVHNLSAQLKLWKSEIKHQENMVGDTQECPEPRLPGIMLGP